MDIMYYIMKQISDIKPVIHSFKSFSRLIYNINAIVLEQELKKIKKTLLQKGEGNGNSEGKEEEKRYNILCTYH
ncbi:unnamed protein product [Gordionus sp. m RMFG-2023]